MRVCESSEISLTMNYTDTINNDIAIRGNYSLEELVVES